MPKAIRAYATRTGLAGHNKNSITDLAKLERELSLVRARGYARDNEELELGVRCMAAGIRDDSGKLMAGLSISAPADRLQEEWLEDLVQTAGQISATLGYRAGVGSLIAGSAAQIRTAPSAVRSFLQRVAARRAEVIGRTDRTAAAWPPAASAPRASAACGRRRPCATSCP